MAKKLTVSVVRTGKVKLVNIRIGSRELRLVNGKAEIALTVGTTYWVYWYLEGVGGSSIALTIADADGNKKVELDEQTEIPPRLGRNAGTKKFVA
jgi:hypothetical protein